MPHRHPHAPRWTGLWLVPVLLSLAALAACGGKTASPPPPPPTITSFQAAKSLVTVGKETTLTAVYSDGKGVVDPGVGAIPAGFPVSTGPLSGHTTFTLRVDGPGGTASRTVDVKTVAPPAVPIITVAPSVTADTLATASVPPQEGCTFAWTISGGTFVGPDTGSTVDFRVGTGNFVQLYCVAVNAAGTDSRPGLALCTISTVPVQPVITAPPHVTAGQVGCTASVPASLTFACQWTIQGGTITAGARSNVVTFTAGTSGVVELRCTLTSAAGVTSEPGVARCLIVPLPTQPVIQAPPFALANSQDNSASVSSQDGCTFLWTVTGGTLTSGDTSPSIRFSAGASGGVNLSCVAVNAAGLRSQPATAYTPIVTAPPKPTLTAPKLVTANQPGYTASVPAVAGYGYVWTIQGGTITSSGSGSSITFTPGASGLVALSCALRDSRGIVSAPGSATCTVVPIPTAPVITAAMAHKAFDLGTASVSAQSGCTYAWSIQGGRFTATPVGPSAGYSVAPTSLLHLECLAINAAGSQGPKSSLDIPVTFTTADVRKALGLDNPPARKKADGTPMTVNDHPFGSQVGDVVNMQRIDEVHLVGSWNASTGTGKSLRVYSKLDGSNTLDAYTTPDLPSCGSWPWQVPVAADLNGDKRKEIFYLGLDNPHQDAEISTLHLSSLKGGSTRTVSDLGTFTVQGFKFLGKDVSNYQDHIWMRTNRNLHQQIAIAAGDLNGDGRDEVVFTFGPNLYVLFFNANGTLASSLRKDYTSRSEQILRVDCADLDLDGKAEIVVTDGVRTDSGAATLHVLKLEGGALTTKVADLSIATAGKTLRTAEVKIGDLNADGKPEIVVAGLLSDKREVCTMVLKVTPGSVSWTASFFTSAYKTDELNGQAWMWFINDDSGATWQKDRADDAAVPGLALADLTGNGTLQIASYDCVLEFTSQSTLEYAFRGDGVAVPKNEDGKNLMMGKVNPWVTHLGQIWDWMGEHNGAPVGARRMQTWYGQLAAGRLTKNPDGGDEILLLDQERKHLRRFYYDATEQRLKEGSTIPVPYYNNPTRDDLPEYLVLADLNDDSTEIQYLGSELLFSRPVIVAAIASPPFWGVTKEDGSFIQQTGNSVAQFGKSIGMNVGASAKFGFSVGAAFGAKATVPVIGNGEAKSKTTVKFSADFSIDFDTAFEREISYDTYAGTDAVVFSCIPIDRYYYKVTKVGPGSRHTLNETIAVERNRPALLQFTDAQFYNNNNGEYPDIDTSIFGHTIGRPFTYKTQAQAQSAAQASDAIAVATGNPLDGTQWFLLQDYGTGIVPRGNLYNTLTYSRSFTVGGSAEFKFEVEHEDEASFGALVGWNVSGYAGIELRFSTTLGESISGSVGGLDEAFYKPENLFRWGIYSHVVAIGNAKYPKSYLRKNMTTVYNFPFKLLNFWVEPM